MNTLRLKTMAVTFTLIFSTRFREEFSALANRPKDFFQTEKLRNGEID
jgi:hypothetical protein